MGTGCFISAKMETSDRFVMYAKSQNECVKWICPRFYQTWRQKFALEKEVKSSVNKNKLETKVFDIGWKNIENLILLSLYI